MIIKIKNCFQISANCLFCKKIIMKKYLYRFVSLAALLLLGFSLYSQIADKTMVVIIDGARYSETFGDPNCDYIPQMHDISLEGAIVNNFHNDGITYTSRAVPALWCGAWTDVIDTTYQGNPTSYAALPTIFEYYRKDKNAPVNDCFYMLKFIQGLWLPSFHIEYGPDYWPQFHSEGETDWDVYEETLMVIDTHHPKFLWVYLADVDHAGHGGNWYEYLASIETADEIVGLLWDKLQSDPFYQNTTTLLVTNDHGRHDDAHGGFTGHGCSCEGCRHIMLLAAGPDIKSGYISEQYRTIPDMAVTASHLQSIEPTYSTGEVMYEILDINSIAGDKHLNSDVVFYPNPFVSEFFLRHGAVLFHRRLK